MRTVTLLVIVLSTFLARAARADAPVKPGSGAALCVLTVADFKAVGVTNAAKPTANVQDGGQSAYCVYAGKSSATGGLELDVFHPAGANVAEAKATEDTAVGEVTASLKPIKLANVDGARWTPNAKSGGPDFAMIVVRRGTLVFVLGVPAHADAESRLTKLASLVLERLAP
jgi:hypothetical protein